MSPTTSRGKSGRKYRYYVSAPLQQGTRTVDADHVQRVSALEIERTVASAVGRWAHNVDDPFAIIRSVCLSERGLHVTADGAQAASIAARLADDEIVLDRTSDRIMVLLPILFASRGARQKIMSANTQAREPDPVLIAALRKAHAMLRTQRGIPVTDAAPDSPYDRNILRLAFLAPDIQRAILDGRQPMHLNLETLKKTSIPLTWSEQRMALGFGEPGAP
ncbi:MAG: hypothetical protein AAFN51_05790 [Pseudomonadota bacterium]